MRRMKMNDYTCIVDMITLDVFKENVLNLNVQISDTAVHEVEINELIAAVIRHKEK